MKKWGLTTFMTKKQWLLSLVLSLAWVLFIHVFGSQHHTFKTKWQDNVSNISATLLFTAEGFNIYKEPVGNLVQVFPQERLPEKFKSDVDNSEWFTHPKLGDSKPLFLVWPEVPRPYPPGFLLWYAPYTTLLYETPLTLSEVTFLSSLVFLFVAHICFFLFFNELKPLLATEGKTKKDQWHKAGIFFFFFVLYTELVRWSGMGQYDLIAMIPLFYSYRYFKKKNIVFSLLFFGIALYFHFRVLFSLGLCLYCGVLLLLNWRKYLISLKNGILVLLTLLLGVTSSIVFLYNSRFHTSSSIFKLNDYHYSHLPQKAWWEILLFVVFFFGPLIWFAKNKLWAFLAVSSSTLLILLTTPQLRGWYLMFVFPIFLLLDSTQPNRRKIFYVCCIFYLFTVSTFINQSPFDFTFFRELIQVVRGDTVS
jgi:hypothetical protein